MNRLLQLKQDKGRALDAAEAIRSKAEKEARALSTEERTAVTAHLNEADAIDETIRLEERAAAYQSEPSRVSRVEVHNNAEDEPYRNFGEFLMEVRQAAVTPHSIPARLHKRAAAGANEKVGSEGGFLVGVDDSNTLLEEAHEASNLAARCTQIPVSAGSNAVTLNGVDETSRATGSRWGGVQGYWQDEADSTTATKPKFRKIKLELKKLMALFYATDEVLQDASVLGTLAQTAFAEEMAFLLDDSIIRGNGAGQPLGVLNAGCLVTQSKESGQSADTLVAANVSNMWSRLTNRAKRNAAWFINTELDPQLDTLNIGVSTAGGQLVYMPPGGLSDLPYGRLKGRPVIPIEQCSAIGDVGDIILMDLSQYLLATKGGVQTAESMHVKFLTDEMTFRFTMRVDGHPARHAAMTPYKGSKTQSAFVTLEAR